MNTSACVHIARILMPRSLTFLSFKDWRLLETNKSESARIESPASRNGVPSGNAASRLIRSNNKAVQIQVLGEHRCSMNGNVRNVRVKSFLKRQILDKSTLSHDLFLKIAKDEKGCKGCRALVFPSFLWTPLEHLTRQTWHFSRNDSKRTTRNIAAWNDSDFAVQSISSLFTQK